MELNAHGLRLIFQTQNQCSKPILVSFIYRPRASYGAAYLDTLDSMISKTDADGNVPTNNSWRLVI